MKTNLTNIELSEASKCFEVDGYYLLKKVFTKNDADKAAAWLKSKDLEKLAKSWGDQEPGVALAVYQNIHNDSTPIAKLANNPAMLEIAGRLLSDKVYIWSSKVNLKASWCGSVEYFHQDYVYWADRGYKAMDMMSCMIFLEPHGVSNGGLRVFPGSHKEGFIEHKPFININGLSKYMVPPDTLDQLQKKYGYIIIDANPGDVLFFHSGLVHGSSHNISHKSRMIILSQLNTKNNAPEDVKAKSKEFNLIRSKRELQEAQRRLIWFKNKYESQLKSDELLFNSPIPEEEIKN